MDIFFTRKHKYTIDESLENVRHEIQSITNRRWYDISNNIIGTFKNDHEFTLSNRWSFAIIRWIESEPAYLTGKLTSEGNKTNINTKLRPNSGFVLTFYGVATLFFYELLFGETFINGPKEIKLVIFPFLNLILFGLIQMYTLSLRYRFERLLHLRRDE